MLNSAKNDMKNSVFVKETLMKKEPDLDDPARRLFALGHSIAHANFCEKIFGFGGILFNFSADICHVDTQNLIVSTGAGTPEFLDNKIVGQYFAGIFAQQRDNAKFAEG